MRRLQMAVAVSAGMPTSQGSQYLENLEAECRESKKKPLHLLLIIDRSIDRYRDYRQIGTREIDKCVCACFYRLRLKKQGKACCFQLLMLTFGELSSSMDLRIKTK